MGLSNDLSCEAGSLSCCRPNPHSVFNQRFEALFPLTGALGCAVCFAPRRLSSLSVCECGAAGCYAPLCLLLSPPLLSPALSVYLHECGAAGSASGQTACPVHPTLRQSRSRHGNASPLCPGCPSLPLLPVWMNVYFLFPWRRTPLPFDFLSVLVVRGGAVCPPTLPSWFSVHVILMFTL